MVVKSGSKIPKKPEVTWCYNPQEDLTLFGSTPASHHHKLNVRPVEWQTAQQTRDCSFRQHRSPVQAGDRSASGANGSEQSRSIDMSLTRIFKTTRWLIAATAAPVTAAFVLASPANVMAAQPAGSQFSSHEWAFAANRNAMRVTEVERTAEPAHYLLASAGSSGLTPVSAEVHTGPHADQGTPLRTEGSIRSDIARYNEERSNARGSSRPVDDTRAPSNAGYRN
jgi:hypothetical protein